MAQYRTDVLVLGGELAGLLTAALLSRHKELRVVVLGHGEVESTLTIGEAAAPEIPFLVADFEAPSALRAVIEELGMRQDVRRLFPFGDPPLQLVNTAHRLDLHEDGEERLVELRREFGDQSEELDARLKAAVERLGQTAAWLEAIPGLGEDGFFARRRLTKFLATSGAQPEGSSSLWAELGADSPMRRWLRALVPFATHVDAETAPPLLAERAAARLVAGTRAAPVGERQLLAQFASAYCASHGGEVLPEARISAVRLARSEVTVGVEGERTERVASFVVDATRGPWLEPLFATPRNQRSYAADRAQTRTGQVVEARHLLLKPSGLPEGIASKVVLTLDDADPVLIIVDRAPRPAIGDKSVLEDQVVVTALTVASAAALPETQDRLRRAILALMPFAEAHIIEERSGADQARALYLPREDGLFESLGPMRPVVTASARMFHVGPDVLPAWGLEGEFRSALKVSDLISAKLVGKRQRPDAMSR